MSQRALAAAPPGRGDRRRVLVVDDEPGMRYMARRVLESRFDVREAESSEAALRIMLEESFHFAIVDIALPGISGLDLLTEIKRVSPEMDVVVMTGSVQNPDEALEDSIRRKAFFFLRKPFPLTILETLADRIVETQELSEQVDRYVRDLERDLEAARVFQGQLLPPMDWKNQHISIAASYVPSDRLSGDFLDHWELPGGGRALLVADVMGHGPSAAMLTGIVKSQIRRLSMELHEPGLVLHALETELAKQKLTGFFTAFLVFDRPEAGRIEYAGAGHPDGYLVDASVGRIEPILSDGLPLNIGIPIQGRNTGVLPRSPGQRLLLYTDGYRELRDSTGAVFDEVETLGGLPVDGDPDQANLTFGPALLQRDTPALFHRAVQLSLAATSPRRGIGIFEDLVVRFLAGATSEDDRAAVLAWLF